MRKLQAEKAKRIFFRYLKNLGYQKSYIRVVAVRLEDFLFFLKLRQTYDIREVNKSLLLEYFDSLENHIGKFTGKKLARGTKQLHYSTVKLFFKGLYFEELLLTNPMQDLSYKPSGEKVRRQIMNKEEMNQFLDSINDINYLGIRDRAVFELMYSSGLRDGEIANLDLNDIDFESRIAIIREGKFSKDRIVPITKVALKFIKRYVSLRTAKRDAFFLSQQGKRMSGGSINRRFKIWLKRAGLYKPGLSAHSVRVRRDGQPQRLWGLRWTRRCT